MRSGLVPAGSAVGGLCWFGRSASLGIRTPVRTGEVGAMTTLAMAGEIADTCPSPDLRSAVLAVTEAAGGARTWSASGRAGLIGELDRAITVLTSVRADLLIAERDGGGWKHAGDPSFEAWRARTSRSGMGAAFREVRCADALVAMPEMRRAAELGQVSVEHVDVVAKVAATGSAPVRQALATAQGQAEVLGLARRLDAGRFTRSMVLWAATLDSVALERSHQAQRAARFLHLADTQTGTRISGQLDRMAGTAFDWRSRRCPGDRRSTT